jgi:hypothetical protein
VNRLINPTNVYTTHDFGNIFAGHNTRSGFKTPSNAQIVALEILNFGIGVCLDFGACVLEF